MQLKKSTCDSSPACKTQENQILAHQDKIQGITLDTYSPVDPKAHPRKFSSKHSEKPKKYASAVSIHKMTRWRTTWSAHGAHMKQHGDNHWFGRSKLAATTIHHSETWTIVEMAASSSHNTCSYPGVDQPITEIPPQKYYKYLRLLIYKKPLPSHHTHTSPLALHLPVKGQRCRLEGGWIGD